MKKLSALFGVVVTVAVVSYLESPSSIFTHPNEAEPSLGIILADEEGEETTETTSDGTDEVDIYAKGVQSSLELKLKETELVDGFIVETYEEYEVYTDKDGKVIKSVPTGKMEYLKYES